MNNKDYEYPLSSLRGILSPYDDTYSTNEAKELVKILPTLTQEQILQLENHITAFIASFPYEITKRQLVLLAEHYPNLINFKKIRDKVDEELLDYFRNDLNELFYSAFFKNLGLCAKKPNSDAPFKIQPITHHIWFTDPAYPREIYPQDLKNVIKTKELLLKDYPISWEHIVWVNNKTSIPQSVAELLANGIAVKELDSDLRELELVNKFIADKDWGKASDTARHGVVFKYGGIYSDLNYEFYRSPLNDLKCYDLIASQYEVNALWLIQSFFAAKKGHVVLNETLNMIHDNFYTPLTQYVKDRLTDRYQSTYALTAAPFSIKYKEWSNFDENVDVIYPSCGEGNQDFLENTYSSLEYCYSSSGPYSSEIYYCNKFKNPELKQGCYDLLNHVVQYSNKDNFFYKNFAMSCDDDVLIGEDSIKSTWKDTN